MYENFKKSVNTGLTLCPLTIRSLVFGICLALIYCSIITTMMFYYLWIDYHKPCFDRTTVFCNRSVVEATLVIGNVSLAPIGPSRDFTPGDIYTTLRRTTGYPNFTLDDMDDNLTMPIWYNVTDLCPLNPPKLVGPLNMKVIFTPVREHDIITAHPDVQLGGRWKPKNCVSRHKVALIIPYRDRKAHLDRLINFLIPILQKQLLDFRIIVAEQYGDGLFNKGRIMNAAFQLAEKFNVDCVIFHDVDMFPESDRNPYGCPDQPRHLGAYVNVLRYSLWYHYLLGGVIVIRMDHYRQVNGHSNEFWGYGGEDDDFGKRVLANNLTIERPPKEFAKYTMLKHQKRKYAVKENVVKLLNDTETRWPYDGLNYTEWSIVSLVPKPLYYHLHVNVGEPPKSWSIKPRKL